MHAVVLHEFGPAENLRYESVPDPEPAAGQVRIAVRAAGVHAIETRMRAGAEGELPPLPELPAVFGGEVSGTVDAVGPGVDPALKGRDVVTTSSTPGGYAELAVADADALYPRPEGLSHQTAVAMVVTGNTTLDMLDIARLTPDDVILVTSAAGGIGRLVVQYARGLGATVVGAAGGPEKTAAVRELGADLAVDYNQPGWERTVADWLGDGRRITAVLDGVGGAKTRTAFELLGTGGRLVTYGAISLDKFTPSEQELAERGVTWTDALAVMLSRHTDGTTGADFARQALEEAAAGRLVPAVQAFPLERAAEAHAALERRETTGKVVLVP
ncbi:zinc-binding dehydrogenase [Streptomyces boncukensis]|uniref:Zinc-binding dehydrogenase n=1 Tax=Streptomyces boncukensis TaxID=2711219 RepID=A0A6G4WUM3_9ACTN|nr:zinc-binding dehydrogenase [Streptomyces boncukensis]NGO68989.1 zinc-binding dehydrogenase [Streptomyces boncukensis]